MGRPSRFDSEFKAQAVALVLGSRKSRSKVALELGLSDTTLANWMAEHADKQPEETLTVSERVELMQLRAEKREWVIEREIIKKAMAWWVKENRG